MNPDPALGQQTRKSDPFGRRLPSMLAGWHTRRGRDASLGERHSS